jgi:hypothetical protein
MARIDGQPGGRGPLHSSIFVEDLPDFVVQASRLAEERRDAEFSVELVHG